MRPLELKLIACLLAAAAMISCGAPGAPVPPQLELPRPVTDLRAFRKGNTVHLSWSTPTQTTEHRNLRKGGTADVCRATAGSLKACGVPVARLPFQALRNATANQLVAGYTDQLPSSLASAPTGVFIYAVSVLNTYGRSAGLSNRVQVPAAPVLAPPLNLHAQPTAEGVQLSWNSVAAPQLPSLRFIYRIYRREQGSNKEVIAGELPVTGQPSPSLLDRSFEWQKTYYYRLAVITVIEVENGPEQNVEGDDTPAVQVVARDVFPPATPSGLQAVFSGPGQPPFIDLVWTPNTEPDVAGYNVYRREGNGEWARLNSDLVKSPAFRDNEVSSGHTYSYSVSAVDVRANESERSQVASETRP